MTDWIREILQRQGQKVTLRLADGEAETRAFLQPVTERTERMPAQMHELGGLDGRLWLYLGKSAVREDDCILFEGETFRVRSSRPYYMSDALLYWWAVLETAKEAAECGS